MKLKKTVNKNMKNISIMDFKKLSEYAEMLAKKTDWNDMD